MKEYNYYTNITREILDTIVIGDVVSVNDWNSYMTVVGVSNNYFVMVENTSDGLLYSVCSKKPWEGIRYNKMVGGMYHCGCDSWTFGIDDFDYEFSDPDKINYYLQTFEDGASEISQRNAIAIYELYIKKGEE